MAAKTTNINDKPLVVLFGPTAVGKTELSLRIAKEFSCEIIGVDSMQVYKYMDIGTAKPTPAERALIPHHLIDVVNPDENFTAGHFVNDAENAMQIISEHNRIPLLTGGTGLYFRALLDGIFDDNVPEISAENDSDIRTSRIREDLKTRLQEQGREHLYAELGRIDPKTAGRIHINDTQRLLRALEIYQLTGIPWSKHIEKQSSETTRHEALKLGLSRPREELYERIDRRVQVMLDQGLLEEVQKLLDMGYHGNLKSMQSIGYRHMVNYINGIWNWDETVQLLARDTRRYAKRQYTWFNNDPEVIWYEVDDKGSIINEIEKYLKKFALEQQT
jgi:tRNA dimethylallyltransferase